MRLVPGADRFSIAQLFGPAVRERNLQMSAGGDERACGGPGATLGEGPTHLLETRERTVGGRVRRLAIEAGIAGGIEPGERFFRHAIEDAEMDHAEHGEDRAPMRYFFMARRVGPRAQLLRHDTWAGARVRLLRA